MHRLAVLFLGCEKDFLRTIDFQADEVWCPRLCKEKLAFVRTNVEDGVVAPRVVDEWNVHVAR